MKPAYAIYLLESEWSWDHCNTEVATLTVEGDEDCRYRKEFECLVDPDCPKEEKIRILRELEEVAKSQNQCPMDSTPRLVRLYRVTNYDGILRKTPSPDETPRLNLNLELICEFGGQNNPRVQAEKNMLADIKRSY